MNEPLAVEKAPSSNAPSRGVRFMIAEVLELSRSVEMGLKTCCQKLSDSFTGAVFKSFLEATLSVEVELGISVDLRF